MTTSSTFPTTASILAPLLIGLHPDRATDEQIDNAWLAATLSIPITRPVLTVATGNNQTKPVTHLRTIARGTGSNDYTHIARLCDSRPNEAIDSYWPRWRWGVGLRRIPAADSRTLLGPDRTSLRLDVRTYRLSEGSVLEAHQLALFRHYLIAGFRVLDPDLIVHGGQHDWHDNWWPATEAAGSR